MCTYRETGSALPLLPPDVARNLILNELDHPVVFRNMINKWPCYKWNLTKWAATFGPKRLQFRFGLSDIGSQWESDCDYVESTLENFIQWQSASHVGSSCGGLSTVNSSRYWVYADYKHLGRLFQKNHEIHKCIDWGPFGLEGRGGEDSTIWIGSAKAHTPCHYDTYGCNLVAQLIGRKQWILFSPKDTPNLYPTRIPYEESSVFSNVDIKNPDMKRFPNFQLSTPYIVTLEPGDVLFVPHKWWHFVTSLETTLSINSWIEMETDDECRLEEAVTRTLVSTLMKTHPLNTIKWKNPTENEVEPEASLLYVWDSIYRCLKNKEVFLQKDNDSDNNSNSPDSSPPVKKKCSGTLESTDRKSLTETMKEYEDIIQRVKPSTIKCLVEEEVIKSLKKSEKSSHEQSEMEEEDHMRSTLVNAIIDPDVISLICYKFKETLMSERHCSQNTSN